MWVCGCYGGIAVPLPPEAKSAWHRARKIHDMDSRVWRRDIHNHHIRCSDYGKETGYGWFVGEHGEAVHIINKRKQF